ncbi:MAG: protease modulator HflC [Alphaproteobacteria bacterium]
MNRNLTIVGIAAAAVLVVGLMSTFIVHQTDQVIVLRFGNPVRVIAEPGLKFKIPFAETLVVFDKRVLDSDPEAEEVIASDQKRLVVDAFARYRIVDPLRFFQTVGNEQGLRARLERVVNGTLRNVIGNVTLTAVLSEERAAIMSEIQKQVQEEAKGFGIDVIDVRIRRADLPQANSEAIFARMKSERDREAKEFRAQGAELAQRIRARADRERTVLIADAQKQAQILRGDGDGLQVEIWAQAAGQDPSFFAFYRSMEAYRQALGADTTMVLSPNSDFFRFFGDIQGRPQAAQPRR